MERGTRKKHYATKTMNIYSFMARMLFFLPDKHRKMLRYYGIYAHNIDKKLEEIDRSTWAKAIEHSFEKNPEICTHRHQSCHYPDHFFVSIERMDELPGYCLHWDSHIFLLAGTCTLFR